EGIDLETDRDIGRDASSSVRVHEDDRPVTTLHVPAQGLTVLALGAVDPEGLLARWRQLGAGALDPLRTDPIVGPTDVEHLLVGDARQVGVDVTSSRDPDEDALTGQGLGTHPNGRQVPRPEWPMFRLVVASEVDLL